ncbi:hypothetical protein SLA2020_073940 [Shorea laevis]
MQKITHTIGSTSFAILRDEMEEKNGGELVGEIDFYMATHLNKDGKYVDEEAESTVKKAKEMHTERLATSSLDAISLQQAVMSEVRGKEAYGRVRGLGLGPTPTKVFGTHTFASTAAQNQEVIELKGQVIELTEQVASLAALVRQLTANMNP